MQDLSGICTGLYGGSSMAGGNTVSTTPEFGAEGSVSEGTADFPVRDAEPDLGAREDLARFVLSGADDAYAIHGWQPTESSAGRA